MSYLRIKNEAIDLNKVEHIMLDEEMIIFDLTYHRVKFTKKYLADEWDELTKWLSDFIDCHSAITISGDKYHAES